MRPLNILITYTVAFLFIRYILFPFTYFTKFSFFVTDNLNAPLYRESSQGLTTTVV